MAYVQKVDKDAVPLLRKSFVNAATAEILDKNRKGEPVDFKCNYPHYNLNDDTSKGGSTRFDSCFKNHGAYDVRESDRGLAVTCIPERSKKVITVPKQVIKPQTEYKDIVPEKRVLKPRTYEPVDDRVDLEFCSPIGSVVDNVPFIKEANADLYGRLEGHECETHVEEVTPKVRTRRTTKKTTGEVEHTDATVTSPKPEVQEGQEDSENGAGVQSEQA